MEGGNDNNDRRTFVGRKAPRPFAHSQFIDDEAGDDHEELESPEEVVGAQPMDDDDGGDEAYDDGQPDVLEYLEQWDIPLTDKVSMLRTAANYLTAQIKTRDPSAKGRRFK